MKYEVIESKRWVGPNGRTASIYGSVPYANDAEKALWTIEVVGFTLRNTVDGTVGIGRKPFETYLEADTHCKKLNNLTNKAR